MAGNLDIREAFERTQLCLEAKILTVALHCVLGKPSGDMTPGDMTPWHRR